METLRQDVRYGIRSLLKSPGFTLVAVLALALGIGANSAIFSVVNGVLLRPLPYPEPDRLMTVWQNNLKRGWHEDVVTPADYLEWRAQSRSFEAMAAHMGRGFNLRAGKEAERIRGSLVSADFFKVLGATPQMGRAFLPGDAGGQGGRVALISHALWQKTFGGDPEIVGRAITLDSEPFTVLGVTPPGFEFPESSEAWALAPKGVPENPWLPPGTEITTLRGLHYFPVIARLKAGVTRAEAQAEMDAIAARQAAEHPDTNADTGVEIVPLHQHLVGEVRPALLVFLGAVGLVLLIACANVANMSLARSAARRREVAIRTALGATRVRLLRQCLTESVLLALLGGGAGLLLALWGCDLLLALKPDTLPGASAVGVDGRVLLFTVVLSVLTGLLFGIAPALQASFSSPLEALQEGGRSSSAGPRTRLLRSVLVVSEMAIALVLLSGSGLLVRSFLRLQSVEPGLLIDSVLTVRLWTPEASYPDGAKQSQFYSEVLRRVQALPGVESVAATTDLPLSGTDSYLGFQIEGRPSAGPGDGPESGLHQVTPDYFRTLGIPILRGRPLNASDVDGALSVKVVSKTLADRYWPGEDPIGKRISYGTNEKNEPQWSTVVGVAGDVRQKGLHAEPRPEAYTSALQWPSRYMTLIVRSPLDPATLAEAVRREVRAVDPAVPAYGVKTLREVLDGSLAARRFNMAVLMAFAAVAVALASIGLYGVIAYMVTQRTHEIGVRLALGARPADVLRLVVRHGMALALAGVAFGVLGALALTRALASLLVGVAATDPWTFSTVGLLLSAVAFLACLVPALRAARVEPMTALRSE
ncbi:MAG TPA: ABC transporter permease [Candidatus Cryosericum sp.]|nr:ABC transporter permease [Candidatus Cryosericum sp.]